MTAGSSLTRRSMLAGSAASIGALAAPNIVRAQARDIRIGYITALSGSRAEFGESDPWMLDQVKKITANGLSVGGNTYSVEFVVKDNQSNPNRSAAVGNELIQREGVDLLLVQDLDASVATGEMSDIAGVPSISTMGPWQAWMFGRGSNPEQGFPYSFTFFWGVEMAMQTFTKLWDQLETNRIAGDFYFDNPAGQAFADPKLGLPAVMSAAGYTRVDGGMYQFDTQDFSAQVSKFKDGNAQIVTGFGFPPNWATFWAQAGQQGFPPKQRPMPPPSCSPRPSKRWAIAATACPRRFGGPRTCPGHHRLPANLRWNSPMHGKQSPASSGCRPWAIRTRSSKQASQH